MKILFASSYCCHFVTLQILECSSEPEASYFFQEWSKWYLWYDQPSKAWKSPFHCGVSPAQDTGKSLPSQIMFPQYVVPWAQWSCSSKWDSGCKSTDSNRGGGWSKPVSRVRHQRFGEPRALRFMRETGQCMMIESYFSRFLSNYFQCMFNAKAKKNFSAIRSQHRVHYIVVLASHPSCEALI